MGIKLVNKLRDIGKGKTPVEKRSFLNNARLCKRKNLNNFKRKIFPIKNQNETGT